MISYGQDSPDAPVEDLMREAADKTGFTLIEIAEMMTSELETSHLLEYITAVTSNRMN